MPNIEQKPEEPKSRDDLIRDVLRAANVLAGSAQSTFGEDNMTVPRNKYNRIQAAQTSLNLATTALRLQLSAHIDRDMRAGEEAYEPTASTLNGASQQEQLNT